MKNIPDYDVVEVCILSESIHINTEFVFPFYQNRLLIKGSVTLCYIYVYSMFMSLFAKRLHCIRFRYIKQYIDTFVGYSTVFMLGTMLFPVLRGYY